MGAFIHAELTDSHPPAILTFALEKAAHRDGCSLIVNELERNAT